MQRQDINLYPQHLRVKADAMSLGRLPWYIALVIFAIAALNGYRYLNMDKQVQQLSHLQLQQAQLQKKLQHLQAGLPAEELKRLDDLIQRRKQQLSRLKDKVDAYQGYGLGQRRGFFADLQAMAKTAQGRVALQRFSISGQDRQIQLQGQALSAAEVPGFLLRLKQHDAMTDVSMDQVAISVARRGVAFKVGYQGDGGRDE